ncbi:MAG: hypothetical protein IJW66_01725 [Clostridia bacterium]|nr:hypothetical protein [Clostridia bacterium]
MNESKRIDIEGDFGIGAILESGGKIIAVITLVVSALVTFTNVSFSAAFTESFTCQMLIMLLSSYLMYFSMEETGERSGEATDTYKSALARYEGLCSRVAASDIPRLRDFLKRYAEDDQKYRQGLCLMRYGKTMEDYEKMRFGEQQTREERKILRSVGRIKPVRLLPHSLLNNERGGRKSELSSPEGPKLIAMIMRLIPTTVCTVFTVSVMLTAKGELSAAVIIEGILKIAALPIIGFKGYIAGYKYARGMKRSYIDTKSRIIEEFISEKK